MSEQIIKSIIDWNPWLEGDFPEELVGITRDYELLPLLELPEVKILEGARRVGKSTLFYQLIYHLFKQKKKILYINFDDDELSKYPLKEIFYTYLKRDKIDYLFLDEIQHCDQWVHFIRKLYDTREVKQIWISGSNSSLIKKEYKTLLSGRNISLEIFPLSFHEFLRFKGQKEISLPPSSAKEAKIIALFEDYLNLGAFPAIALRKAYHKELFINYFEDIIYKDIVTRHDINAAKIKEMGVYLATNSGKNFSYRSVGATLNLHPKTVTEYISYFTEVFLFSELYKFDYSIKTQFSSDKKIYSLDTGLAAANAFCFSENKGRMLENLVHNELKRQGKEIYFHKQKKECDFIIKEDLEIIQAIQVCYSVADDNTKQSELDGLLDALDYFKLEKGLILTMNEDDEVEIKNENKQYKIQIKSVWKWLLELALAVQV